MENVSVARLWADIAQMHPRQMVGRLSHLVGDERVLPGYVGANYATSGLLLIGTNPSGDAATDGGERVYEAIEQLDGSVERFDALNACLAELMQTWPVYLTIIKPLVDKCGLTLADIAFLNLLPVHVDKGDRGRLYDVTWHNATGKQVSALTPRKVVCLGQEAYDFVSPLWKETRVYCIRRSQSDRTNIKGYENTLADIERVAWYINPGSSRPAA